MNEQVMAAQANSISSNRFYKIRELLRELSADEEVNYSKYKSMLAQLKRAASKSNQYFGSDEKILEYIKLLIEDMDTIINDLVEAKTLIIKEINDYNLKEIID